MKTKIVIAFLALSMASVSYARQSDFEDYRSLLSQQETDEVLLKKYYELMTKLTERGLAEEKDGNAQLSDKGESLLDKLEREGRLGTVQTAGGSICW